MHPLQLSILTFTLLCLPIVVLGQEPPEFRFLVGVPGIDDVDPDFGAYINALYALSIAVAGLLAVVKLVIAGVKYMLTDIVTTKADAKKDIQGALLGLLIVLAAVLILTVINEDLVGGNIQIEEAGVVPPPPAPFTSLTPSQEDGFTWIPLSATSEQSAYFANNCSGTLQIYLRTNQYRCVELTDEEVQEITDDLPEVDADELTFITEQYTVHIRPYELTDQETIDALNEMMDITTEPYFVYDFVAMPEQSENEARGICADFVEANGGTMENRNFIIYDGTTFGACIP